MNRIDIPLRRVRVSLLLAIFVASTAIDHNRQQTIAQEKIATELPLKTEASAVSFQSASHHLQLMQLLQSIDPYRPTGEVEGKAVLSGSTTMVLLGQTWSQRFRLFHPKVEFTRGVDGSDAALEALAKDPHVIAGVSRNVTDTDLQKLKTGSCKDPMIVLVALDPIAIYVHKDNPIQSMTPQQIQKLLGADSNGRPLVSTWGELDVKGTLASSKIRIHHRSDVSGTKHFIHQSILNGAPMAEAAETHKSNHDICNALAKDPAGIALCGFGDQVDGVRTVALQLQGTTVEATEASFLAGRYPLVRPLSLVLDRAQLQHDSGLRESILRYILSRDGQREAILAGFFPLNPDFIRQELVQLTGTQSH